MMNGPRVGRCSAPSMASPNQRCSTWAMAGRSARWSRGASRRSAMSTGPAVRTVERPIVPGFIAWAPGPGEPVAGHGGVVLFDGRRELVVLVVLFHEVQVFHWRRIEDGVDRAEPRVGDRPGRQARPLVGVVGVVDGQVGPGQRSPVL